MLLDPKTFRRPRKYCGAYLMEAQLSEEGFVDRACDFLRLLGVRIGDR